MEDSEELREAIVSMRRELDMLRTEAAHASTLLNSLDALLVVSGEDDPFAGVFSALLPVFDASHAVVLAQSGEHDSALECVASNDVRLTGSRWLPDSRIARVLAGKIVTTLSSHELGACMVSGKAVLSDDQPAIYLPLGVRDRRGLLILLRSPGKDGFDRTHVTLARKFSLLASHALAAREAHQSEVESLRLKQLTDKLTDSQQELAFRANHDQLTGLPNRAYVQELVDGLLANKQPGEKLALAFIDLDDFKRVNDIHGHAAGDALLCEVADRIRSQLRPTDILGRISGDEFVVILNPLAERRAIVSLVDRIRDMLQKPFDIEGVMIKGGGSIGVSTYPTHGRDYETLRRNADAAMYRAKTLAKGSVHFFNRSLGRAMSEKLLLEQRLRAAFEEKRFKCVLQAKVDIHTRRIVGFETLVRWVDEQGNVHAPGTFLASASELGLLDGIAGMQLEELLSRLPDLDLRYGDGMIYSFNVSANQASRPAFMKSIIRQIANSGRSHNFTLELTEESFLKAEAFQSQILPLLRAADIGISIDDFGTGYSSLSLLADITADEIKIDRSFVKSIFNKPQNQSILRAIESLGRALDISMVAEGIETEEELSYLRAHTRIQFGQGYLFHRPQFIDDLARPDASLLLGQERDRPASSGPQAMFVSAGRALAG